MILASLRTRILARSKTSTSCNDIAAYQSSILTRREPIFACTAQLWRSRSLTTQAATSPAVSNDSDALHLDCTVFLGSEKQSINKRWSKSYLCQEHGLQPRDLRKIDSTVPNARATILAREQCILVNILKLRVLIKSDCVWLIHSGEAEFQDEAGAKDRFIDELQTKLASNSQHLAYEHKALDAVLSATSNQLDHEMSEVRTRVLKVLDDLADTMVPSELQTLLFDTRKLSAFLTQANSVQTAIDEVLANDEDLNALYLSAPIKSTSINHQAVEIMLESYSQQVEEVVNEAQALSANVTQTREVIEILLDTARNRLIVLDLRINILTMTFGGGALVAGIFGMNLTSGIEEHPSAFYWTTTGIMSLGLLLGALGLMRLSTVGTIGLGRWASRAAQLQQKRWNQRKIRSTETGM